MRKARYLAAGVVALAKPFFLAGLASSIQLSDGAQLSVPFLRYLLLPQTIPALCLFFLWYDTDRYGALKPLTAFLAISSIAMLAFGAMAAAGKFQLLLLTVQNAQGLLRVLLAALGTLAIDLLCLFVLLPDSRRKRNDTPIDSGAGNSEGSPRTASQPQYKEP
jgi:hypothetical protein